MSTKRKLSEGESSTDVHLEPPNIEAKISNLINAVKSQGPLGNIIIFCTDEDNNPYVPLQNGIAYANLSLVVGKIGSDNDVFAMNINGEELVRGTFENIQLAKRHLAEMALNELKKTCFFVTTKKDYVNVTRKNLDKAEMPTAPSAAVAVGTSIAHKIMGKMGWHGQGLGAHEQGSLDSVMVYENVNRQGFGTRNLMREVTRKLASFSRSSALLTLVFDSEFTKEERVLIHKVAKRFNLKSKSIGTEARKLTVSKKITKIDIVRELLKVGGDDGFYKLHIPTNFSHLW